MTHEVNHGKDPGVYPNRYRVPGVYRIDDYPQPERERLATAVPAFLGVFELRKQYAQEQELALATLGAAEAQDRPEPVVIRLSRWLQFTDQLASYEDALGYAVHGFFENGGQLCYLVSLQAWADNELDRALERLKTLDPVDLVCAPGLVYSFKDACSPMATGSKEEQERQRSKALQEATTLQAAIIAYCDLANDRFAILDALLNQSTAEVIEQRERLKGTNGALYYPWVGIHTADKQDGISYVPPCGHVAGIYARSDQRHGVHKAPANELLMGVLQLERVMKDIEQGELNEKHVNCLRSFRGRGIRVWGARTLADEDDRDWIFVNVRRLFITLGRWIQAEMVEQVFEPNNPQLWARIEYRLRSYCMELLRKGALAGASPDEAFYVRCNAATNPEESRNAGQVITLIGLAPTAPAEFIEVRIIHGPAGVTLAGPGSYLGRSG